MNQYIKIIIKKYGEILIHLTPESAPINTKKLIEFIKDGLFNNRYIQRIAYDFVLQFTYENYSDPRLECILPLERSDVPFKKGTVALGGDGSSISSPSDFFITITDTNAKRLENNFTVIGYVEEGYEVIEKIIQIPTKKIIMNDAPGVDINEPLERIEIEKIIYIER